MITIRERLKHVAKLNTFLSLWPPIKNNYLGLHTLSEGVATLSEGVKYWKRGADRLNVQQLFSGSAEGKEDGLESLRERYKRYKESYVKYMRFDPEEPNPS